MNKAHPAESMPPLNSTSAGLFPLFILKSDRVPRQGAANNRCRTTMEASLFGIAQASPLGARPWYATLLSGASYSRGPVKVSPGNLTRAAPGGKGVELTDFSALERN